MHTAPFNKKQVYCVFNFGHFRGWFSTLKEAKEMVDENGTDHKTGKKFYQIWKTDIEFNNCVEKKY